MRYGALFAVLTLTSVARAEVVTVPFQGKVIEVNGLPFGILATPGVTKLSGFFMYDTELAPDPNMSTNGSDFRMETPSGFVFNIGGVQISSSSYDLGTSNNSLSFGGCDFFKAIASSVSSDFRINGIADQGSAQLFLVDSNRTLYRTDADVDVLPPASSLEQIDFMWGFLSDGIVDAPYLIFVVPEPAALLILAPAILLISGRRVKRR